MRLVTTALLFMLLQACKHPLAIVGEGDIVDQNGGPFGCTLEQFQAGATACTENETTGDYFVNYQAVPRPGWQFVRWEGPCGHLSEAPDCRIDTPAAWVAYWDLEFANVDIPPTTAIFELIPPPADPEQLLPDAAQQAAKQVMLDFGFDQQSIDTLALNADFAPKYYGTKITSESAINVLPGITTNFDVYADRTLIIRWNPTTETWVTIGEPEWLPTEEFGFIDTDVVVGESYSYASVLVNYIDGYNYTPLFSVTMDADAAPIPGTLRVAVVLATFEDTVYEISAADMEAEFERVQAVYEELSYGQQIIEATIFDTGKAGLSQEDTLELLQSMQIMNWIYFDTPDYAYLKPCDIDAIAILAQDILDQDEFPENFPFSYVTDITTIDIEGVRPYGCEQLGAGGILARHIGIPEEINLERYDLLVMHPYGDEPLGDGAFNNASLYSGLTKDDSPVTVALEYIFQSGSPLDANSVNYGHLSGFQADGLKQDESFTQGQLAQNLFTTTLIHEFGHALGIKTHGNGANVRISQEEVNQLNEDPLTTITQLGGQLEYGDYFDVMGTNNYAFGMNPWYREFLGWLSVDRIQTINQTQTGVALLGLNSPTGVVAAKIPVDGGWIFVSYRPAVGYDETLNIPELIDNTRGAMLHFVKETGFPLKTSYLLDATDAIEDTVFVVLPGDEFSLYGVTIKNAQVEDNLLSFDVEIADPG